MFITALLNSILYHRAQYFYCKGVLALGIFLVYWNSKEIYGLLSLPQNRLKKKHNIRKAQRDLA